MLYFLLCATISDTYRQSASKSELCGKNKRIGTISYKSHNSRQKSEKKIRKRKKKRIISFSTQKEDKRTPAVPQEISALGSLHYQNCFIGGIATCKIVLLLKGPSAHQSCMKEILPSLLLVVKSAMYASHHILDRVSAANPAPAKTPDYKDYQVNR